MNGNRFTQADKTPELDKLAEDHAELQAWIEELRTNIRNPNISHESRRGLYQELLQSLQALYDVEQRIKAITGAAA